MESRVRGVGGGVMSVVGVEDAGAVVVVEEDDDDDDDIAAVDVPGVVGEVLYVVVPAAWRLSGTVPSLAAKVLFVVELYSLARQGRRKVGGNGSGSAAEACHRVSSTALLIALLIMALKYSSVER